MENFIGCDRSKTDKDRVKKPLEGIYLLTFTVYFLLGLLQK